MNITKNNFKPTLEILTFHYIPGYTPALSEAMFIAKLNFYLNDCSNEKLTLFDSLIKGKIPEYDSSSLDKNFTLDSILIRILIIIKEIMKMAKIPIFNSGIAKVFDNKIELLLPSTRYEQVANKNAVTWVITILNQCLDNEYSGEYENFENMLLLIKKVAPLGVNTYFLLKAANTLNIPWTHIYGNMFQFGWGRRVSMFDSTISEKTSALGVILAKDKLATSQLLKNVGLPVCEHKQVFSEEDALKTAQLLGYPVVVKPIDLDAGLGVAAYLKDENSVKKAYLNAKKLSSKIMVEKHFTGNEYRVAVIDGEILYITQRIPGGVVGDGINSINTLLTKLNNYRKETKSLSPSLLLNEESLELLEEANIDINFIPEKGQYIRLRRIANISVGGTIVRITDLSIVHKDNVDLVLRAASVLRLDISGIDLIIPSLEESWLQSGAIINEVNSQPQISSEANLSTVLSSRVKEDGRIPIIISFGTSSKQFINKLIQEAKKQNKNIGIVSSASVSINDNIISKSSFNALNGALLLLNNSIVDVIIINIEDTSMLEFGLAVDSFDAMIFENDNIKNLDSNFKFIDEYSKMCKGSIFVNKTIIDSSIFENLKERLVDYDKNLFDLLSPILKL
jgi:cyanophycin synthetase